MVHRAPGASCGSPAPGAPHPSCAPRGWARSQCAVRAPGDFRPLLRSVCAVCPPPTTTTTDVPRPLAACAIACGVCGLAQITSDPITVDGALLEHEVYISGCHGATIILPNKVKTIAVDTCKQCKIVFEGAISSLEVRARGVG